MVRPFVAVTGDARTPHVLLLIKGIGLGGAERLIVEQALRGGADDVRYTVAYIRPDKDHFRADLEAAGVEVVLLDRAGSSRRWPVDLVRALRHLRPDVVHTHSPLPAAVARVALRLRAAGAGAAHVYTEHNRWSAYVPATRAVNAVTMPLDAHIWAVSDETRSSVKPARVRRRVETLHHGIDQGAVVAAAARGTVAPVETAAGPGRFTFVHVANRRPEKAHEVLLEAFTVAVRDEPELRLWLVGQHLDEPVLADLLDSHPARDRIAVLGYRSDAPALMSAADALVLSSDHEGLPVAVMEALGLGRPIVSTAVGGVPEAVRDGREALLVAPRSPDELAGAMVRLAQDESLYTRLAQGAKARAPEFDARRATAHQVEEYKRQAARRSP
jgi:glycosyltransferase involved in cell wall biosynthesis